MKILFFIFSILKVILYKFKYPGLKFKGFIWIGSGVKISCSGRIVLGSGVVLKDNVRLYAGKNALLEIKDNVSLGHHTEISCMSHIRIGKDTLTSAYVYIGDFSHGYSSNLGLIRNQKIKTGNVIISQNVWIGRGACVFKGSVIGEGSVIGANSVISKVIESFSIIYPAKLSPPCSCTK